MEKILNIKTRLTYILIIVTLFLFIIDIVQIYVINNLKDKNETEFFLETRKAKNDNYTKTLLTYKAILDDHSTSKEVKQLFSKKYLDLADKATTENQLETTLKSIGFKDVLLYLSSNTAEVIVRDKHNLSNKKEQLIKDIIYEAINISDIEITRK